MWLYIITPTRSINNQVWTFLNKKTYCLCEQFLTVFNQIFINLTFFSKFSNLFFSIVENAQSQHFELVVEADVKGLHDLVHYFFSDFFEDVSLILACILIKISYGTFYDLLTLILKLIYGSIFGSGLELLNLFLNLLNCLFFNFATSILSNHFSLIR